jgi:hypothetical protein
VDILYHIDFLVISGRGNGSITVVQKIESKNTDSDLRLDRTKMENMHALQGWQQRHKDNMKVPLALNY